MNCISVSFDPGTDHVDATGEFDEAGVLIVRSATGETLHMRCNGIREGQEK